MNSIEIIIEKFDTPEEIVECGTYGRGHINDTYLTIFKKKNKTFKYILRKINRSVFASPELIVENSLKITEHIEKKMHLNYSDEKNERSIKLKKTIDGQYFHKDNNDDIWCMLNYIDGSYTVDQVETAEQSLEAAKTYGRFLKYLWDFNPDNCHITIKDFHNLQNRIQQFNSAIEQNPVGRIDGLFHEIEKISKYGFLEDEWLRVLEESMPLRITHNDTKISNVLLDKHSNKGLCVIDLDTVMPGYIINDFGDMVRTFAPSLPEDHQDLNHISVRLPVFESLIKGFLDEIRNLITEAELKYLVSGALFITYEQALRFLTDFILGDIYYKTDYENHNLYRAQNQLILLEDLILKRDSMEKMILQNI